MGKTQGDSLRTNTIKTQKLIQIYNVSINSNFLVCFYGDIQFLIYFTKKSNTCRILHLKL